MNKQDLINFARSMDFDIHGFEVINGKECVKKKTQEGDYIYWPIEVEGSGFERIFRGFSKYIN